MPTITYPKTEEQTTEVNSEFTADYANALMGFSLAVPEGEEIKTQQQRVSDMMMYAIPNTALGAAVEIGESMPGLDEKDMEAFAKSVTTEGMYQNFVDNENGYRLAGSVASSFIPIVGVTKVMKAKKVYDAISKVPGVGKTAAKLLLPSRISTSEKLAKIRESATVLARKQQNSFMPEALARETIPGSEGLLSTAIKKTYLNTALDNLKIGVGTDLTIWGLYNESQTFFPDEMSTIETMAMYGLPTGVVAGVSGAYMRYQLKNVLRDVGPVMAAARNPADLPIGKILSRPGKRDNLITAYSAQVHIKEGEAAKIAGDDVLHKNLNSQIQAYGEQITHETSMLAKDSVVPEVTTSFKLEAPQMATVNASLKQDYSTMQHVYSVEKYNAADAIKFDKRIKEKITKLDTEARDIMGVIMENASKKNGTYYKARKEFETKIAEIETLKQTSVVKLNRDGSMQLAAKSKEDFDDIATGVTRTTQEHVAEMPLQKMAVGDVLKITSKTSDEVAHTVKYSEGNKSKLATADNTLHVKDVDKYDELSFKGKTATQTAMRHAINDLKVTSEIPTTIKITDKLHHLEADAILEIADKMGRENPVLLNWARFDGTTIKTFDDLEFLSLQSKYKDWVSQSNKIGKQGLFKVSQNKLTTKEDLIQTLNLPNDGISGVHPLMQVFQDVYMQGYKDLRAIYPSLELFKKDMLRSVVTKDELTKEALDLAVDIKTRGSALTTFPEKRDPVTLLIKNHFETPLKREDFIQSVMEQRTKFLDDMGKARKAGAPMISDILDIVKRDPDRWETARRVDQLIDNSQIHGDKFTQTMFGLDNQPAIIAADSIANEIETAWRSFVDRQFRPHNPTFQKLLSNAHEGDLNSFALAVNQQGRGWRGVPDFVPVESGGKLIGYKIPLEKHTFNSELFLQEYKNIDMPDELFIPQPKTHVDAGYEPLVISPLAAEAVLAFNDISQNVLTHINYLRNLSGKPKIARKALHMVPPNLTKKETLYLINKDTGNLQTIKGGNTPVQVKRLADEEISLAKKQGINLFIATEKDLQNYQMLKLQAFETMTDYSTTFAQTGQATGKSFGQTIEIGSDIVTRMQETLINQYNTISKVSRAMIFEPEFKAAELALATSGRSASSVKKVGAIQQSWMNRTLGNKSGTRNTTIGKFYGSVEDAYDSILQTVWDAKVDFFKGGQTEAQAVSGFAALEKAVPEYNPFKNSVEFLENTMKIKAPSNMRKHMSKINNLTGLAMLRMFEVGLGLVNIGTLPTIIPPVVKALKRQPGQSLAEWKKLNAAWASTIDESTAIWNPYRATSSGMHWMFKLNNPERKRILNLAAERGHLWQKTVEQLQLFTAPAEGYVEHQIKHYTELSSLFVDKTEELSRSISYATFFNMGKRNLKLGDDAAMEFAHTMANRVIGDFRPNNRPQVYQGAVGMPFGLFTTFAINYLQRVFGYLEKGQMKAFLNQMGLQTMFFGAKSLPGFNQYIDHFTSNYDGTENLVDRLENSVGSDLTDALMFGSVGSLTGLASYTRTDIRLPGSSLNQGFDIAQMAPAASLIKKTLSGISEIGNSLVANGGINSQQISEILSTTFPIKAVRGWMQLALGEETDSRGQMIDSNLRNTLDAFSRVSAMRTIKNQRVVEEFARQRSQGMKQAELRTRTRKMLRSLYRGGKLDGDSLDAVIGDYLKAGGDPSAFRSFLRTEAQAGLIEKGYLRALSLANQKAKEKDFTRLMNILADE